MSTVSQIFTSVEFITCKNWENSSRAFWGSRRGKFLYPSFSTRFFPNVIPVD